MPVYEQYYYFSLTTFKLYHFTIKRLRITQVSQAVKIVYQFITI